MSVYISGCVDMVCPMCEGSGKKGKKEECDLCVGWGWVSLAVHDEYVEEDDGEG